MTTQLAHLHADEVRERVFQRMPRRPEKLRGMNGAEEGWRRWWRAIVETACTDLSCSALGLDAFRSPGC